MAIYLRFLQFYTNIIKLSNKILFANKFVLLIITFLFNFSSVKREKKNCNSNFASVFPFVSKEVLFQCITNNKGC